MLDADADAHANGQGPELGPYMSLPHVFHGRRVIHYVDNESALCASISGYSSQGDSSRLVNMLHVVRLHLRCNIWFLYVPSESNMSDWPSRGRIRDVLALGARAVRMVNWLFHRCGSLLLLGQQCSPSLNRWLCFIEPTPRCCLGDSRGE